MAWPWLKSPQLTPMRSRMFTADTNSGHEYDEFIAPIATTVLPKGPSQHV